MGKNYFKDYGKIQEHFPKAKGNILESIIEIQKAKRK
jgi:hypothetical protein